MWKFLSRSKWYIQSTKQIAQKCSFSKKFSSFDITFFINLQILSCVKFDPDKCMGNLYELPFYELTEKHNEFIFWLIWQNECRKRTAFSSRDFSVEHIRGKKSLIW